MKNTALSEPTNVGVSKYYNMTKHGLIAAIAATTLLCSSTYGMKEEEQENKKQEESYYLKSCILDNAFGLSQEEMNKLNECISHVDNAISCRRLLLLDGSLHEDKKSDKVVNMLKFYLDKGYWLKMSEYLPKDKLEAVFNDSIIKQLGMDVKKIVWNADGLNCDTLVDLVNKHFSSVEHLGLGLPVPNDSTFIDVSCLQNLNKLKVIGLDNYKQIQNVTTLGKCQNLELVTFRDCGKISKEDLGTLKEQVPNLKICQTSEAIEKAFRLCFSHSRRLIRIDQLISSPLCESLYKNEYEVNFLIDLLKKGYALIASKCLSQEAIDNIFKSPWVEALEPYVGCVIWNTDHVDHLAPLLKKHLPKLDTLCVGYCVNKKSGGASLDVSCLRDLNSLTTLRLDFFKNITNVDQFWDLPNLQHVHLGDESVISEKELSDLEKKLPDLCITRTFNGNKEVWKNEAWKVEKKN